MLFMVIVIQKVGFLNLNYQIQFKRNVMCKNFCFLVIKMCLLKQILQFRVSCNQNREEIQILMRELSLLSSQETMVMNFTRIMEKKETNIQMLFKILQLNGLPYSLLEIMKNNIILNSLMRSFNYLTSNKLKIIIFPLIKGKFILLELIYIILANGLTTKISQKCQNGLKTIQQQLIKIEIRLLGLLHLGTSQFIVYKMMIVLCHLLFIDKLTIYFTIILLTCIQDRMFTIMKFQSQCIEGAFKVMRVTQMILNTHKV
ncbi:transmembrane protein, putative (macronuclear) [Tetrahymena thermophila SB210]|uniref:Transmembrane protein, putative n=1 Tax=Tetrahymena thermophila (strain SB210) TaxID=312017 RepID=W7X0R9_TETTS|nr:transmembrane protein, putative [Tetrahymena thermophila SB210]EWS72760.1 transmembrane protein, putative [Tetrahymena thermophila SB210]|eukprot:XP_012654697.1 transmembrane protein, putative [Tetrahymena thermophila SB210]